uniref:(northern house mosquito) hypothetical protein n=1 Tax=Culex pipiens TaxID=7175 RepID=A0A8D8MLH5_CULPI
MMAVLVLPLASSSSSEPSPLIPILPVTTPFASPPTAYSSSGGGLWKFVGSAGCTLFLHFFFGAPSSIAARRRSPPSCSCYTLPLPPSSPSSLPLLQAGARVHDRLPSKVALLRRVVDGPVRCSSWPHHRWLRLWPSVHRRGCPESPDRHRSSRLSR